MSVVMPTQRVGSAHVRELNQILVHGQQESRTALVDINLGTAWAPGNGGGPNQRPAIDHQLIAAFGSQIFSPNRVTHLRRESLREMIMEKGGINMVAVLMTDCDLFIAPLPGSTRVVSLIIRHSNTGTGASDSVIRGRSIRAKLGLFNKETVAGAIEKQTTQSYSIWNTLFNNLTARFRRTSGGSARGNGLLDKLLNMDEHVLAGDIFDLKKGNHIDHYHAQNVQELKVDARGAIATFKEMAAGILDVQAVLRAVGLPDAEFGKIQVQVGKQDFYWLRTPYFPVLHVPFDPDRVLLLYKEPRANPSLDWVSLDQAGLNMLRLRISSLLESGMPTSIDPFPETHIEFQALLDELGTLAPSDLLNRLDIGGFLARPREIHGVTQRCQECIYYLPHRQWCDLPELPVPVKSDWWCRLWKI